MSIGSVSPNSAVPVGSPAPSPIGSTPADARFTSPSSVRPRAAFQSLSEFIDNHKKDAHRDHHRTGEGEHEAETSATAQADAVSGSGSEGEGGSGGSAGGDPRDPQILRRWNQLSQRTRSSQEDLVVACVDAARTGNTSAASAHAARVIDSAMAQLDNGAIKRQEFLKLVTWVALQLASAGIEIPSDPAALRGFLLGAGVSGTHVAAVTDLGALLMPTLWLVRRQSAADAGRPPPLSPELYGAYFHRTDPGTERVGA